MRKLLFLLTFLLGCGAYAQQPQAYALFDHSGKTTSYAAMMDSLSRADVVFFGEMHNCPITHWMEQNVLQTLGDRFGKEVMVANVLKLNVVCGLIILRIMRLYSQLPTTIICPLLRQTCLVVMPTR